jgi:hypothetical protein
MQYITLTAEFDQMDLAEAAARKITHQFPSVKSVKIHYRREAVENADHYSSVSLTASNALGNYTNIGYGVVPPQGAQPMFAVYRATTLPECDYLYRKVRLSVVAPSEKKQALTSCILNSGGHFVKEK